MWSVDGWWGNLHRCTMHGLQSYLRGGGNGCSLEFEVFKSVFFFNKFDKYLSSNQYTQIINVIMCRFLPGFAQLSANKAMEEVFPMPGFATNTKRLFEFLHLFSSTLKTTQKKLHNLWRYFHLVDSKDNYKRCAAFCVTSTRSFVLGNIPVLVGVPSSGRWGTPVLVGGWYPWVPLPLPQ